MPPKGPQTLVETILLWSVKSLQGTSGRSGTVHESEKVLSTLSLSVKPNLADLEPHSDRE